MFVDLGLYLLALMINIISALLPAFDVWPSSVTDGLAYFTLALSKFNFILPVDTLFSAITFFVWFETAYLGIKLIFKIVGFFRKSESLNL